MKRNTGILSIVAVLSAIMGVYVANHQSQQLAEEIRSNSAQHPATTPVQQLFSLQLPDSEGQMQALSQWRGKPLVLNFWASWCTPCVKEMPELSKLQKDFAGRGVQVLGIGIDSAQAIKEFKQKQEISYPLLVSGIEGSELARALGNQAGGLPFTVLIGADGKIHKTYLGILKFDQFYMDLNAYFPAK